MMDRSIGSKSSRRILWALATLVLAGCDGNRLPSAPTEAAKPHAAVVVNERRSLDTVVTNNCTGEDIALTGTVHTIFSITESRNGGFHLQGHMTTELSGTGLLTGISYRSISTSEFSLNANVLPFEQTSVSNDRLLGRGPGDDLKAHSLQHITVDANGNLRVFNDDFRFECT